MKTIALLALLTITAKATVSLTISSNTVGNLTNLQNSSGAQGALVWGIVVDGNNNGFQGSTVDAGYDPTFSYLNTGVVVNQGGGTAGYALTVGGLPTDDRLYISSSFMASSTNVFDGSANLFRPTALNSVTLQSTVGGVNPLVNPGDSFAIIWFDATAFGAASVLGQKYGMAFTPTAGSTPTQALVLGSDSSSLNYASNWFGTDPVRLANLTLGGKPVPETSTTLLGAIGALALLRRRRK